MFFLVLGGEGYGKLSPVVDVLWPLQFLSHALPSHLGPNPSSSPFKAT